MADLVNYEGKRVLVVGGATGMGGASAKRASALGAHTIVMDIAPVAFECGQYINVDLSNRASVDAAIEAIDGPIHAVLSCAGVADGAGTLMLINFISQRHIVEELIRTQKLGRGGAVAFISSGAALAWMNHLEQLQDFLATPDWDSAAAWVDEHEGTNNYSFSKQVMNAYVAGQAFNFIQKGIRINGIMPAATDTPLAQANKDVWLSFGAAYREAADLPVMQPEEMGDTLLFLCSDAAKGINGSILIVDQGHMNASLVDAFNDPIPKAIAEMIEFDPAAMLGVED